MIRSDDYMFGWLFKKSKDVLVVEDDDDLRNVLIDRLKQEGYHVIAAKNGDEALKLALHEFPKVILLDLMLPQRDGVSFLEQLRHDPEWGHAVPVIVLTNLIATTDRWDRISALGIEDYIEKADFSLDRVVREVNKAMKQKMKRRRAEKLFSPEKQAHTQHPEEEEAA